MRKAISNVLEMNTTDCQDDEYDVIKDLAEYADSIRLTPKSLQSQIDYLHRLPSVPLMKDAVDDTILHGWRSIVYSVDHLLDGSDHYHKFADTPSRFTDTAGGAFKAKAKTI